MTRFVDARRLARRADEQAGEQVGQRRVALPVEHEALQQVRPAQERAVRRRRAADDDMVAAAGAGVAAVDHELVGAEPRLPRFLVDAARDVDAIAPGRGGMHVDLDDAGVGRHLDDVECAGRAAAHSLRCEPAASSRARLPPRSRASRSR